MKKENLKFVKDSYKNWFITNCIFNTSFPEYYKLATEILENSRGTKAFVKNYLGTKELELSQGYAELSKVTDEHWHRVRNILGSECRKVMSDIGGIKIGNDDWSILIPNGYGDGTTRYAVLDKKFNHDMVNYFTMVEGTFNIYSYDCGNDVAETLSGKYMIYYYQGMIIFKKSGE